LVAGEIARAAAEAPPARLVIAATRLSRAAGEIGQDGSLRRDAVLRHRAEARAATPQHAPAMRRDVRAGVAA
jgi:hypothetical protein